MSRKKWIVALALVAIVGGLAWWQRGPLLARHYVNKLCQAGEAERESWAAAVVELGKAAAPALLSALESSDQSACNNVECALVGLVRGWGVEDARSLDLLKQAVARYGACAAPGKNSVLHLAIVVLRKSTEPTTDLTALAGDLLATAATAADTRVAALRLAAILVERAPTGPWIELSRRLADEGLTAQDAGVRAAAAQLLLRPPLRHEPELLAKVMPLLKDGVASVRKSALLVLGPATDIVSEDDLLPLLHDADEEVRNLCALALRSRGLQESHILLARLISDERPSARLEVLQHLGEARDLEPGVWLRRLCQDPAPAVRAAAVRAAVAQTQVDLRPCLDDMARQDPSPTVRQLAGYYLQRAGRK